MCGIVAILRRSAEAVPVKAKALMELVRSAESRLPENGAELETWAELLAVAAREMEALDRELRGLGGVIALVENAGLRTSLDGACRRMTGRLDALENRLDREGAVLDDQGLEVLNAAVIRLSDAVWSVGRDRLGRALALERMELEGADVATLATYDSMETVLAALDRLEVRGRDSAGVHVLLGGAAGSEPSLGDLQREADPLFASGAVRRCGDGGIGFVYKAAAEIGELGDNGKALRREIGEDALLRRKASHADPPAVVLGHTRWASVGLISEPNAHPLNQEEVVARQGPYVVAALNGDVDNYVDLVAREGLSFAAEITTDAKVIPALIARRLECGDSLAEAFRSTVSSFSGSVAIAAQSSTEPRKLLLAQHGSGQALYVGLLDGAFVVASEPYGLVEQTPRYIRLDGETPGNPENPSASRGQIVILDADAAGTIGGILRFAYDGTPLPVGESEIQTATITTRDIDRGDFPHFLLKEISQASNSFRKTLRGKLIDGPEGISVALGEATLPMVLRERLRTGIRRILVVGQGTAAIAGRGVAEVMRLCLPDSISVDAMPATELSGFRLRDDMSDTLVCAISQSGTTTDTNRTVDLVRSRGALVVSIVNRRGSDLTDKSDGVLYTSDGRDVEMSVASTKAFYSQVAAGHLLALGLRQVVDPSPLGVEEQKLLRGLREIPEALDRVLELRPEIGRIASEHAPSRRYWAVVGNGGNLIAAEEIRIKLSELCYKSIACDATEDKKHIDLSSEPLIIVCAAGLRGSTLDDVAKEVAIYNAHKAKPVVIVTAGARAFDAQTPRIEVPEVHPHLAYILSTMVGHLFGYEAALAIDGLALPLHEIRAEIEDLAAAALPGENLIESLAPRIEGAARRFGADLARRRYDGSLEASTAARLSGLLRYVSGISPLESFLAEFDEVGTPAAVIEALTGSLTRAIEELTRPIDAIKHQAKTVTVGISRADEALLVVGLVRSTIESGVPRDHLSYRDLRALAGLDPAVASVDGFTRYRVAARSAGSGSDADTELRVIAQGGVARQIPSRTAELPVLRGTKHLVAEERQLLVARGRSDGRTVILIPEVDRSGVVGILLLHVTFEDHASPGAMRGVLSSYRNRYVALRDAVMETEPDFDEERLGEIPVADLLTEPVHVLAVSWQSSRSQPKGVLK